MNLDKLLESVADAVSAMVIFSNEAGNNMAVLRNLKSGAEGVRNAVMILIGQARQTVELWNKLGSIDMSNRMSECCDGLAAAVTGIVKACDEIQKDPHDNVAKSHLLDEGKDIVKQMVALLQFNDLYDVVVCLKKVILIKELSQNTGNDDWLADDFANLVRGFCEHLEKRQKSTNDTRVQQMLKESQVDMEKLGVGLASIVKRSKTEPAFKAKIQVLMDPLEQTIQKATKAIKLSCKSPFDLGLLDTEFRFHDDDLIDEIIVTTSDFHASLNAVKKAIKAGDEFELERAIRAIEKDLRAQIAAAEELANQTHDPYLRAQMLAKIKAAKSELENLMNKLRTEGKQALITGELEAIEALLADVGKIYNMIVEGTALNELLKASESLNALLEELPPAVKANDELESKALLQDIGKEVSREALMAHAVAQTCDDDYRKHRILTAAEDLENLNTELKDATNKALAGAHKGVAKVEELVRRMQDVNNELNMVAATTTTDELVERAALIHSSLKDLQIHSDIPHANSSLITEQLNSVLKNMQKQVNLATSWASRISDDPDYSDSIKGQARLLQNATKKLAVEAKTLMSGANKGAEFDKNKRRYLEAVEKVMAENNALISLAVESPDEQLEALQGKIISDMRHLKEAIARKDLGEVAHAIADLKRDVKDLSYIANMMAHDIDDPEVKKSLLDTSNLLVQSLANILDASKKAIKNPNSKDLDNIFTDIHSYMDKIVDISGGVGPEDKMQKNAEAMNKINKNFLRNMEKQEWIKAEEKLKLEKKKVEKQKQLARAVANRCDFNLELSSQIVEETTKLDDLLIRLQDTTLKIKEHPNDERLKLQLKKDAEAFRKQATLTGKLANDIKTGRKEAEERQKEEARLAEERKRKEAEERELQMAKAIPVGIKEIWVAAKDIQDITLSLLPTADDSPIGNLVQLADRLAKVMQELAALSRTGTKKDIIMCARKIADMVSEIEKHIQGVTENCRDPHLNRELTSGGQVAKNYAIQLKIICGVKAGLILEEDAETAQALIVCARGLCKNVGELVNLSQIAKLKPKK